MDNKRNTYDLIEDYLLNRLSEADRVNLEERLESDAAFRHYFEVHKSANEVIKAKEELGIKQKLQEIHMHDQAQGSLKSKGLFFGIGIIFAVAVAWWVMKTPDENVSSQEQWTIKEQSEHVDASQSQEKTDELLIVDKEETAPKPMQTQNETPDLPAKEKEIDYTEGNNEVVKSQPQHPEDEGEISQAIENNEPAKSESIAPVAQKESQAEVNDLPSEHECETYPFDFEIHATSSCLEKQNGSLLILGSEGSAIDSFSLNEGPARKTTSFNQLSPGEYTLKAIDEYGCTSLPRTIEIEGFPCNFIIYPVQNQYWKINLDRFKDGEVTLEIYNGRSGKRVYASVLSPFEMNQWDGRSNSGQELAMGSYSYVLRSNGVQQTGNLTIMR